jgi:hypothetical protein
MAATRRTGCVIGGLGWCLLCRVAVAAGVVAEADADAWLKEALTRALEANERWERTAAELRAENARLRGELVRRDAKLERVNAELAVLQRLVSGRSSERARPVGRARHGRLHPAAAGLGPGR